MVAVVIRGKFWSNQRLNINCSNKDLWCLVPGAWVRGARECFKAVYNSFAPCLWWAWQTTEMTSRPIVSFEKCLKCSESYLLVQGASAENVKIPSQHHINVTYRYQVRTDRAARPGHISGQSPSSIPGCQEALITLIISTWKHNGDFIPDHYPHHPSHCWHSANSINRYNRDVYCLS